MEGGPDKREQLSHFDSRSGVRNRVRNLDSYWTPKSLTVDSCSDSILLRKKYFLCRKVLGARLESVYTGNRIVGSNPTLSAILKNFIDFHIKDS